MNAAESNDLPRELARGAMTLAYFAGLSLIVGWSLPEGFAGDRPVNAALPLPGFVSVPPPPSKPVVEATRATRGKVNCVGCGVIESVHRIDTPIAVMAECHYGEDVVIPGHLLNVGGPDAPESLAGTVASVIADGRGRRMVAVDTRHRIVVRFRDGSRQVFDEATPRSLRVGDRIVVIGGTAEAKGAPGARTAANGEPWRSVRFRTDG